MLSSQRHLFDVPRDTCYLNSAYMGPRLFSVSAAGHAALETGRAPWEIGPEDFFKTADLIRDVFGALIGSDGNNIALVPSVSYAMAVAAANLDLAPGSEILLLDEQFPSNVYPWRTLAARCDASICTVPRPDDGDWTTAVIDAICERTALAALPQAHWTDGSRVDLEVVNRRCKEVGCALVLDLTQSLGASPFSVEQVQPDFMVAAAYKWLLGPYGLTYLYVSPSRQDGIPIEQTWMGRSGSEDFSGLVNYQECYREGARRFDAGEHCSFVLLPMALAGLRQIASWTPQATAEKLGRTIARIGRQAAMLGFDVTPPAARSPHMLGLTYPESVPSELLGALATERVYVSVRGRSIRVAPHLHVDDEDLERFFAVLGRFAP